MCQPNGANMKLSFVVLSLFPIIQSCYSAVPCALIPPGLDRVSHGVDATTFDLFPPDLTTANGLVHTVFDFTCDQKKKWTNPYTNQVYDLPDQVASIVKEDGSQMNQRVDFHINYQEYSHTKGSKCGLGLPGIFGFSHSSSSIMESICGDERVLTEVSAYVSAYRVKLIAPAAEHAGEDMTHDYNLLPNDYNQNPGLYQKFLNDYGTHFFQESLFGGLMKIDSLTTKQYAMTHTAKTMASEAGISFLGFLGVSGGASKMQQNMDRIYQQSSVIRESYYGGTADLIKTGLNGFNAWKASAQKNPWLFEGHLEPITSFLPNGPKKNAVGTAIGVKIDWAYLDECSRQMQILKQRNPYINVAQCDSFIQQLNVERAKPIPPHDRVNQLGKQVEDFFHAERGKAAPKPPCKLVLDKNTKKPVCVNPATCTCIIKY